MYRKPLSGGLQWTAMATALVASSVALADDSSISRLTGDSYAYFNGLEYRAGQFNVEKPKLRASAQPKENSSRANEAARNDAPMTTRGENARPAMTGPSREAAPVAESKILLASPRLVIVPPVTFKDDTA